MECKKQSKQLQEKLERICGFKSSTDTGGLEMKPTDYKAKIKETLEQKQETIAQDKAECDEESDDYKTFQQLEQKTEQDIEEVKEVMQKPEPEEMVDMIDSLKKNVETLQDEKQQTEEENIRLKVKTEDQANEMVQLTKTVESMVHEKSKIEKEVEKYKKENDTLKANTNDAAFTPIVSGNESLGQVPGKQTSEQEKKYENEEEIDQRTFPNEDVTEYICGYPNQIDNTDLNKNSDFFMNRIPSGPKGDYIDNIHVEWWCDYQKLEEDRKYMQWLFPVRAKSCNRSAQELLPHEIQSILNSEKARTRLLTSYKMMLDFYGMELDNEEDGTITRSENWKERFENLNSSEHNYNRITRILKCLGELGFEHLKKNFIKFVLIEIVDTKQLVNLHESCLNYWIEVLKTPNERAEMKRFYQELLNRNKIFKKFNVEVKV